MEMLFSVIVLASMEKVKMVYVLSVVMVRILDWLNNVVCLCRYRKNLRKLYVLHTSVWSKVTILIIYFAHL